MKKLLASLALGLMIPVLAAVLGVGTATTTGCGIDPFPLCGCLVLTYNGECTTPDPMSTGWEDLNFPPGYGVEGWIEVVNCPNSGNAKDDAGKLTSAASSTMSDQAKKQAIKHAGLKTKPNGDLDPVYNPTTMMSSFVKVIGCEYWTKAPIPDAGPRPSKEWFRYHSKQRPSMNVTPMDAGGGGVMNWDFNDCEPMLDDNGIDITFWSDCPFNPRGVGADNPDPPNVCSSPDAGTSCNPVPKPTVGACALCMADLCCEKWNACVNDQTAVCQCLIACSDTGQYPACDGVCSSSSLTAAQAKCLACANECPALINPPAPPPDPENNEGDQ